MVQLFLTFLPVLTVAATVVLAAVGGAPRRVALVGVPLLGTALSWAALPISGEDGNMLAVLLVLLLTVGLAVYYPILLIVTVIRRRRL